MAFINYLSSSAFGDVFVLVLFAFLIGSILIGRDLKTITYEEHAVGNLTSALSAIEEYEQDSDSEQLELAAKELGEAGKRFGTFGSGSTIYSEAFGIHKNLGDALRKKLPYLLTQTNGVVVAKEKIGHMRSILLNPSLEEMKVFTKETGELQEPPKPPPRQINWTRVTGSLLGQVVVSGMSAILLPLILLSIYALVADLEISTVMKENLIAFVGLAITTFLGVLSRLGRK